MSRPAALLQYGWLVLGYGGRTAAYLALTAILAATLDPAQFGRLSVFLAIGAGVAAVAGAWPFLAVPVLASRTGDVRAPLRGASLLAAGTGALALLAVLPLADLLLDDPGAGVLVALGAYALALVALQATYAVLQTQERMRSIALVQTAERALAAVLVGVLAAAGLLGVEEARGSVAVAATIAAAAAGAVVLRGLPRSSRASNRASDVRRVLRAVGPMGVVAVCGYLVAWFDVLALSLLADDRTVGLYALAYQVFTVPVQIAGLWIVATLPRHAREGAGADDRPSAAMVLGWAGLVALLAAAAALLLRVGFGDEYRAAAAPALVLMASVPPLVFYFVGVPILLADGRAKVLAVMSIAGAIVNIVIDVALIPSLGLWAPVIATVMQNVGVTLAMVAVLRGRLDARLLLAVPAVSAVAAAAVAPRSAGTLAAMLIVGGTCLVVGGRELRRS
jgi:O-antigen/teichoic acid export membrane protein